MNKLTPDEVLQRIRWNEKAIECMNFLCVEQSCSPEEINIDIISMLSDYGLIDVVSDRCDLIITPSLGIERPKMCIQRSRQQHPFAPILPGIIAKRLYRCVLTDLGHDVCSVLLDTDY
jgi:hypothetical protein